MDPFEALKRLKEKFTSGNEIPVGRATITREEWEAIIPVVAHCFVEEVPEDRSE